MSGRADEGRKDWGPGTTVSVFRLPSADRPMARAIGIGALATRLEVGRPLALRIDAGQTGRVLAGTTVVAIESVAPDVVRIATRNHRYELRQVTASLAGRAAHDFGAAADVHDHPESSADRTQVVSASDWPETDPGRFASGAQVRVVKEGEQDHFDSRPAILLVDLVPGEPAAFSIEGRIVTTSPIREVVAMGADRVRLHTGNSAYLIELVRPADGEDPLG